MQLCLWGAIAFLIITLVLKNNDLKTTSIVILCITWFIYFINAMCSRELSYLCHKQKNFTIHNYMVGLFKTMPSLSYSVCCYHYETHHYTTTDKDGHVQHHSETRRHNTYNETRYFNYYSSRDRSGIFILDTQNIRDNPGKYFIKLHLKLNVMLSIDGTVEDYIRQRDTFYIMNRFRDTHMDTSEATNLPGFEEYNLVSVGEDRPSGVNCGMYVLFVFLGFIEFYKLYVDQFCIAQNFCISKEVSTRRNLNAPEYNKIYQTFDPSINIQNNIYKFDDPSSLPINTNYVPENLPVLSEVESNQNNHATMINQIPQYNTNNPNQGNQTAMTNSVPAYNNNQFQSNQNNMMTNSVPAYNNQNQGNQNNMMSNSSPAYQNNPNNPNVNITIKQEGMHTENEIKTSLLPQNKNY